MSFGLAVCKICLPRTTNHLPYILFYPMFFSLISRICQCRWRFCSEIDLPGLLYFWLENAFDKHFSLPDLKNVIFCDITCRFTKRQMAWPIAFPFKRAALLCVRPHTRSVECWQPGHEFCIPSCKQHIIMQASKHGQSNE